MIEYRIIFILVTFLLVMVNAHAAFDPPATEILPKLFITKFKNNTLYLNKNILLNTHAISDSWNNVPYDLVRDDVRTIDCKGGSNNLIHVLSCNKKYILQLNVAPSDDLEPCLNRFPTVLIERDTGKKILLNKKLSACTGATAIIESKGWLWFASFWSGDHGRYYGDGLFRVNIMSGQIEFISRNGKAENGWNFSTQDDWSNIRIFSLAMDEKNHSIWFTSTLGLHHFKPDTQHLTSYYTRLFIDDKGKVRVGLSKNKPEPDLSLYSLIINLKIYNKTGFEKAWQKLNLESAGQPPMHDDLIPYYIETLSHYSDSHNDMYLFNSIVHDVFMFNKHKFSAQLEKIYHKTKSLDKKASLQHAFQQFGLPIKNTTNNTENAYLLAFVEGKKKYWQVCDYYQKGKISFDKVNVEVLARSGKRLTDMLLSCFSERGWNIIDKSFKSFISTLYDAGEQQSKLAICRFFNRKKWYKTDNQLLKKVVLDLPVFSKKYGFTSHECKRWLFNTITTDEQILFIQNINNRDRALHYAKNDLFRKLQRRRHFPIFKKQHEMRIKQEEDACRRQRKTENRDEWKVRCKDAHKKLPIFQPGRKLPFLLPPPADRNKPTIIYK